MLYSPPSGPSTQRVAGGAQGRGCIPGDAGIPGASLSPGPQPGVAAGFRGTSFALKPPFQGSPRILPRAKEGGAPPPPAMTLGGRVGARRHFAGAFSAKVARNPVSRGRDNEQELKGIQVEKPVNARATRNCSREVDVKLCGSLPRRERVFS